MLIQINLLIELMPKGEKGSYFCCTDNEVDLKTISSTGKAPKGMGREKAPSRVKINLYLATQGQPPIIGHTARRGACKLGNCGHAALELRPAPSGLLSARL